MFENNFQNGTFFDLFDPKCTPFFYKAPTEKTKKLYALEKV